ncbi:MCE family protein [Mycolicibacterium phlei]|uniref:MCE-family protein MCE3A n=1 Tax=Mycolicibacterium phlei DSM 43239 = CCUG 21000 TaxID=1226750 RepID=A0A5N5UYR7_MYCPH|nr:MCE family protein [Mycolicibacterium phlei]KAB7754754.1 MCE-family protein MCE3A [Mycolicibacterium phlei DSM 43239 = CCUG 21000]KXW65399.1 MCE-family protein MCE3A [Mycolicibacterium phlei DSM 43239 = CCUG 21000]KXW79016.1 MCE-family protein MCE3A [Mycolicibacterium phlei DSM 43071]
MAQRHGEHRVHPGWWALGLVTVSVVGILLCLALFAGTFRRFVPVTLVSERSGLVMETGAKVKMRGVPVGRVGDIKPGRDSSSLRLEIFPQYISEIPANVDAEIRATTAFGAKYVELIPPSDPSAQPLQAGAVVRTRNVSTEVNTVFQSLVSVLHQVDPPKLNAVLTAIADGVRGQGERIGEATTAANEVLLAINPRMDTVREDWRALERYSDTYTAASQDIVSTLGAASTTSKTITDRADALDNLLLNVIGFANVGTTFTTDNKANLISAIDQLEPTTGLLLYYSPTYTCTLVGGKIHLDNGAYDGFGGNGRTEVADIGLLLGEDPYRYPDHLPKVAAKGGPGGKPSCGSLPDVAEKWPVRQLVTNTGWGTGLDIRPNPGIGNPWFTNFFPTTRAVPEAPHEHHLPGPAIGPVPYPGAPPYGAPLYGPDGQPLWAGPPPGAPPPPVPGVPNPPPPYGTGTGPQPAQPPAPQP